MRTSFKKVGRNFQFWQNFFFQIQKKKKMLKCISKEFLDNYSFSFSKEEYGKHKILKKWSKIPNGRIFSNLEKMKKKSQQNKFQIFLSARANMAMTSLRKLVGNTNFVRIFFSSGKLLKIITKNIYNHFFFSAWENAMRTPIEKMVGNTKIYKIFFKFLIFFVGTWGEICRNRNVR